MNSIYVKYVSTLPSVEDRENRFLYYCLENSLYYRGKDETPMSSDIVTINSASLNLSGVDA